MEGIVAAQLKLSVSMIVKDEQENIAQCLNSVKDADEIIVVDTGSKDETPDIAKSMGVKVFFFPWRDNFAEAYNFADSRCQGDWILSIDADERLEEGGIKKIRKLIKDEKADWIDVKIDYENSYHYFPKLIKKIDTNYWIGAVHRTLASRWYWNKKDITIYAHRSISHRKDPDRTIRILRRELEEHPELLRERFFYGMELAIRQKWYEALSQFEIFLRSLSFDWLKDEIKKAHVAEAYLMRAKIYRQLNCMIASRESAKRALEITPNFREAADFLDFISCGREREEYLSIKKGLNNEGVLFVRKGDWCDG